MFVDVVDVCSMLCSQTGEPVSYIIVQCIIQNKNHKKNYQMCLTDLVVFRTQFVYQKH